MSRTLPVAESRIKDVLALVDRRYSPPLRRRELGFEVLLHTLGPVNYERLRSWRRHGRMPNLASPRRYSERISARKLYEDIPNAPAIADKVAARNYVADRTGPEYLREVFQVASDPAAINFELLPEAFVAKTNHGSRMNIFVAQKGATDLYAVRALLSRFLRRRHGHLHNEWWYGQIEPKVMVEEYLDIRHDYRFMVYHGRVEFIRAEQLGSDGRAFFNRDWRALEMGLKGPGDQIPRPARLAEMIAVAEALAAGLPFLRVDLLSPDDRQVLFGEMTLAPGSGWTRRSEAEEVALGAPW